MRCIAWLIKLSPALPCFQAWTEALMHPFKTTAGGLYLSETLKTFKTLFPPLAVKSPLVGERVGHPVTLFHMSCAAEQLK